MVTKLDRLARPVPDARDIAGEPTARQVKLKEEVFSSCASSAARPDGLVLVRRVG